MACEVWIVGTEGSLDFWTTIKLVLDISFAGSSVLVVSADEDVTNFVSCLI